MRFHRAADGHRRAPPGIDAAPTPAASTPSPGRGQWGELPVARGSAHVVCFPHTMHTLPFARWSLRSMFLVAATLLAVTSSNGLSLTLGSF